jgi:outer membrane protein OmpA-like peptidoglycan-associated protein
MSKNAVTRVLGAVVMGMLVAGLVGCGVNKKEHEALKQESIELRERLSSLEIQQQEAAAREAELQRQLADKDSQINALRAQTQVRPVAQVDPGRSSSAQAREEVITIAGDVAFASGSATLTAAAKRELDAIAQRLNTRYAGRPIRVEGHTDSDPIRKSSWPSNQALSQARAEAVVAYLTSKGVSSSRLTAVGMGSSKPKRTKAESRRVEIHVLDR